MPDIYSDSIEVRKDGNLLFTNTIGKVQTIKNIQTFLFCTGYTYKNIELIWIGICPQYSFRRFKPVVDIGHNRGVYLLMMMYYIKQLHWRWNRFRIQDSACLVEYIWSEDIICSWFPVSQLGCSEYECREMAVLVSPNGRRRTIINLRRNSPGLQQ